MNKRYTVEEIASKLKVSKRTILREIARGKLLTEKVGRRYLITEKNLKAYLGKDDKNIQKNIKKFINSNKSEMVNLLHKLVSLASDTTELGQEGRLANYIKKYLDDKGIRCVFYTDNGYAAVRASFGYADDGLLLNCPLDTIPPGDISRWTYPPFEGVIKKRRMYGRGTADAKAGIVSMIYTILALKQYVDEQKVRVELVFDGGEQSGAYHGMKMVLAKGLPVKAGIIGYACDMTEIAMGARGYHRYTFTTKGRAVHTGSRFKKGVNAISKMTKFILEFESAKLPKSTSKLFYFGSRLTFSIIEGGRAINIIPDSCIARLDVRTTPELNKEKVDKLIEKIITRVKKKDSEFNIDYKYDVGQESYVMRNDEKIINSLKLSIKNELNKEVPLVACGPAHVGNLLSEYNIPTVIWGPKGENVHSYDEYVEIDTLTQTSTIYSNCILNYFNKS